MNDGEKEVKVLIVRDGECWLATEPGKRTGCSHWISSDDDDAKALLSWLRQWGRKELNVEVRDF